MKINTINSYNYSNILQRSNTLQTRIGKKIYFPTDSVDFSIHRNVSFNGNPIQKAIGYFQYLKAQKVADDMYKYVIATDMVDNFILRDFCMEPLEGLQFGIKVFDGLSMKDIQYMSENLHVIAVKRGCTHMCGHCYADAKPQNREMSWEDFTKITQGYKKLRERMHGLDLFGKNISISKSHPIYRTTELFYDADCMDLAIKDKKGNVYDFIELSDEIWNGLGRTTVFDTSGWSVSNTKLQERAEKYAQHFAKPENMKKLEAFNISFNVFNASYIASRKALKQGDYEKARRLKDKFTTNMANTIFTFTPLLENPKFNILERSFDSHAKKADGFNVKSMALLRQEVFEKVKDLYISDLQTEKKYIKSEEDLNLKLSILYVKLQGIDTGLNSSGRMKQFMKDMGIKANLLEYDESMKTVMQDLKDNGRYHKTIMHRLIDTDGKVYHMNYARFFPTEIRLNLAQKDIPSPKLANLQQDFVVTKEMINRPEIQIIKTAKIEK